ncbi:MAG: hypothetical protein DI586_07590, partial [Micavibrio aeruginosavorus]
MKFNFTEDKRLMQASPAAAGGGPSDISSAEDQRLVAELAGKTPEQQAAIIRQNRELAVQRATADKNAGIVGSSGVEASDSVRKRAAEQSQQNSADAARNTQDVMKDALMKALALYNQSAAGLMQSEQSIEQMKAGVSGMLEVLGVVCKKLGAEDFGQGCLELAEDLKPELVKPNAAALKAIEDYKKSAYLDPTITQGMITYGQNQGGQAIDRGQS